MNACIACGLEFHHPEQPTFLAPNAFFDDVAISQCPRCGLIQPNPLPAQAAVDAFYGQTYYRYGWLARAVKKRVGDLFARSRKFWIDQYIPLKARSTVLEIGCAANYPWMELANALGWPLLYRGTGRSFAICAIVKGE